MVLISVIVDLLGIYGKKVFRKDEEVSKYI